jgi:hypothetical protein
MLAIKTAAILIIENELFVIMREVKNVNLEVLRFDKTLMRLWSGKPRLTHMQLCLLI